MEIRQTLTQYVQKQLRHHLDNSGEGITAFGKRIGIPPTRIHSFLAGASSFRLDTADKILEQIEKK